VLTGSAIGPAVKDDGPQPYQPQDAGHCFLAIDVQHFMPLAEFEARQRQMVDEIHACQPAEGVERIYVPGEMEMETAARRRAEGIPLRADVVNDLARLGEEMGEAFPAVP
jgi:LDH2 family malate/lactate/ureidoglycolate dehydrogenase